MNSQLQAPSVEGAQKAQVEDWLRQVDRLIRTGRYLAADEIIQRILKVQPHNASALSYQDRVQFLVRQLSKRVGLNSETQTEVRKFMDVLNRRKDNQVQSLLLSANQLLEHGEPGLAAERVARALTHDPTNTYAAALRQRINDVLHQPPPSLQQKNEMHYRSLLMDAWQSGPPNAEMEAILTEAQSKFGISHGKRAEIQREVKNQRYKESLQDIWQTGGLAAFDMESVERLREQFEISRIDHALIESSLLRDVRKNRIRAAVLVVDADEESLLSISQTLRSNHFAVIAAASLAEALTAVKSVKPDLIVSEVEFPDGALGFDLFGFIRSTQETKRLPFVFVSREIDRTTRLIGKRAGVDDFLLKPVDPELLVATMTGLMARYSDLPGSRPQE